MGDCLAHDGDKRLRALEGERDEADTAAPAERQSGSGGEGRQALERQRPGCVFVEAQLQRSHSGLSQEKGVDAPAADGLRLSRAAGEGALDELRPGGGPTEVFVEPVSRKEQRRGLSLEPPEDRPGLHRLAREADDLLGRLALVRAGGERLPQELERGLGQLYAAVGPALGRPLEANGRDEVRGRHACERLLAEAERKPRAVELQRGDDLPVDRERDDSRDRGSGSRRNSPDGRRRGGIARGRGERDLTGIHLARFQGRSVELGCERGRLGVDSASDEAPLMPVR
jgi:hypothetical protein